MKRVSLCGLLACGLWCGSLATLHSQSYAFTTLAGQAGASGSADGTNATVRFSQPGGAAVDSAGNVYVADTLNDTIRKLTLVGTNWVASTLVGKARASGSTDDTNSNARFFFPYGVAVDQLGRLYVADTYNSTIRLVTPEGTNWVVSTPAGLAGSTGSANGPNSTARFYLPYGLALDSAGNIYVADTYNHTIRQITPVGPDWVVSTLAGFPGAIGHFDGTNSNARFQNPSGLAVDGAGNVYVADTYNHTVRQLTPVGTDWVVTTLAGLAGVGGSADGTNGNARFNYPFGITIDSATNLYVADTYNDTIRQITPVGTNWVVSTLAGAVGVSGSVDGGGSAAQFYQPLGLAADSGGKLYVADTFNSTLRFGQLAFSLQAYFLGGQLIVAWPLAATNFVLETSSNLPPGPIWSPLTNGIAVLGNVFVRTNDVTGPAGFYRLHKH